MITYLPKPMGWTFWRQLCAYKHDEAKFLEKSTIKNSNVSFIDGIESYRVKKIVISVK